MLSGTKPGTSTGETSLQTEVCQSVLLGDSPQLAQCSPTCFPIQLILQSYPIQKDILEDVVIHLAETKILLRIFITYQSRNSVVFLFCFVF